MGWKSDWLYGIIFAEFEKAWKQAQKEGKGEYGPASERMIISQYSGYSTEMPHCYGYLVKSWDYNGKSFELYDEPELDSCAEPAIQGMFYKQASGSFAVSENRRAGVITYVFGPRYGRGFLFDVIGQGEKGEIRMNPGSTQWIS